MNREDYGVRLKAHQLGVHTRYRRAQLRLGRLDKIFGDHPAADNYKTAARRELASALAQVQEFEDA